MKTFRVLPVLALLCGLLVWPPFAIDAAQDRGAGYFTNLEVVTQDGETVRFYDNLIKGKLVVVSFIFTSCTDMCPINTARMTQVADALGDPLGRDVFFISISIDPENYTPEKMKSFADAFYEGPGWTFITGSPENLKTVGERLGNRGEYPSDQHQRNHPRQRSHGRIGTDWRIAEAVPADQFLRIEDMTRYQL